MSIFKSKKVDRNRSTLLSLWDNFSFRISASLYLAVLIFWFIGSVINTRDPNFIHESSILIPPDSDFIFGTDQIGRDQFSRLASAIPFALAMSATGVLIGAIVGVILGVSAAYIGSWYERLVVIATNVLLGLPSLLLAILVVGVLGNGRLKTVFAVSLIYIPEFSRLGRLLTGHIKNSGFVVASRLMGFGRWWILRRHILRNVLPSLVVLVAISLSTSLLAITALSFLGLGVVPPDTDLGNMLSLSLDYISLAPWLVIAPSLILVLLVVAANFLGDSLSRVLDSRQSG